MSDLPDQLHSLTVIVPSRGRPDAAVELTAAFADTCEASTYLLFAVDADDPTRHQYAEALGGNASLCLTPSHTMVEALNLAAATVDTYAIGFLGDDHRPRTKGWDARYLQELQRLRVGMVYGDDLLQSHRLPTQIAMTTDIVKALGWMCPPDLRHMYVDNWWLALGRAAGCIRYLPDVVVEHMHPVAGKAEWTEGHRRVNAPSVYEQDHATLSRLHARELPAAAAEIRALRESLVGR